MRLSQAESVHAHTLQLGDHTIYISYKTIIGYRGPAFPAGVRTDIIHSHTTNKHVGQFGIGNFTKSEAKLGRIIGRLELAANRVGKPRKLSRKPKTAIPEGIVERDGITRCGPRGGDDTIPEDEQRRAEGEGMPYHEAAANEGARIASRSREE